MGVGAQKPPSKPPLNFTVTQLLKIGGQPLSLGGGVRYYADAPKGGPEGFGARLIMTFLFPESPRRS